MKIVDIVIPTRKRLHKLVNTIKSLYDFPHEHIHVVFDGDEVGYKDFRKIYPMVNVTLMVGHNGSVSCRNAVIKKVVTDGLLYATDDVIFHQGSVVLAIKTINEKFPDGDGVVGFYQDGVNESFHPAGVALLGRKFLDRYPGRKLFNPDYFHFACQEIHWYAERLNKFYLEPQAILFHKHPCFYKEEMDECHIDARIHKTKDHNLIRDRKTLKKIWPLG